MPNSQRVGKDQERAIVNHARANGFPGADRIIRTGAGKDYAVRADQGDIWLCPGVIVQSKRLSPVSRMERCIKQWQAETNAQRIAAGAAFGVLIVRREGTTDVGDWWAWLTLTDLHILMESNLSLTGVPVRLTVADAYTLLRAAGYGSAVQEGM